MYVERVSTSSKRERELDERDYIPGDHRTHRGGN